MKLIDYKDWLNEKMDYYAAKAQEAENDGAIDEMNHYSELFDLACEAFHRVNAVEEI